MAEKIMIKVTEHQRQLLLSVLEVARDIGYGNLILHLQTKWAADLMARYGFDEKAARDHTARDGTGLPFQMQNDILIRGEWDETGKSYQ